MPRQINDHNSKEYINLLRSEIFAKITDDWKDKWAKNHGTNFTEIANLLSQDAFFEDLRIDIGLMLAKKYGEKEAIERNLSTDTLGRFFDKDYPKNFSKNTLDILSLYAGYEDFVSFKKQQSTENVAPIINVYTLVNSPREIAEIPKYIYELPDKRQISGVG